MEQAATKRAHPSGRPPRERVPLNVFVRKEQALGLRELAERRDVPQAQLVREALDRLLAESAR